MNSKIHFIRYIPVILWSGFIFFICLIPGNTFPKEDFLDKIYFDKIIHAILYLILFLLLIHGLKQDLQYFEKLIFVAAFFCILQGILIECLQGSAFIRNRSFEFWDIAANIGGVVWGIILFSGKHKTN